MGRWRGLGIHLAGESEDIYQAATIRIKYRTEQGLSQMPCSEHTGFAVTSSDLASRLSSLSLNETLDLSSVKITPLDLAVGSMEIDGS